MRGVVAQWRDSVPSVRTVADSNPIQAATYGPWESPSLANNIARITLLGALRLAKSRHSINAVGGRASE